MEQAGPRLKKIRQEKGISLEEAHKKTKVHPNILKAIEGDGLTNLNPVYLKGFLKIYCKFLGVDPKDYVPDYKEIQARILDIPQQKGIAKRPGISLGLSAFRLNYGGLIKVCVFILAAALVFLGLFNLGKLASHRFRQRPQTALANTKARPSPKTVTASKQAQASAETAVVKKKEVVPAIRLVIKARANCWTSVKVDGKTVFQKVLEKGRSESWNANERIELSLGNAGAVELEVNGSIFSNLGRRGEARKNIVITREGLNIGR